MKLKMLLITLLYLLPLKTLLSQPTSEESKYPKRIVLDGDTVIVISLAQEDSINVAYIKKAACEKQRDALKDYKHVQDSLMNNAKVIISNLRKNETELTDSNNKLADKATLAEVDRDRYKKSRDNLWWTVGGFSITFIGIGTAAFILLR